MSLLLLLTACHMARVSDCVSEQREVTDDEELGDLGFTVADLVADIAGLRTFPASRPDGSVTTTELSLARADAPAVFDDTSWDARQELRPGLFESTNMMFVRCEDQLTVPLEVDLTSAAGLDIGGEANAITEVWGNTTQGVGGVSVMGFADDAGLVTPEVTGDSAEDLLLFFDGPELVELRYGDDQQLTFPPVEAE